MKISPKSIIILAAVLMLTTCDEGEWQDAVIPNVGAAESGQADLSRISFVFEWRKEITDVTASVHRGKSEYPLEVRGIWRRGGLLIVEVEAERGRTLRPHFYFLASDGGVLEEYRAEVRPERALITFHDQSFGKDEKSPSQFQPDEVRLDGGVVDLTLPETSFRVWVDEQFVDLRQVITLPPGAEVHALPREEGVIEPSSLDLAGISAGIPGDSVRLEVVP